MIARRTLILALCAACLGVSFHSNAQQKIWRLGYLDYGSRESAEISRRYATFIEAMRGLGHVEGKDFVSEVRYAEGKSERLSPLAAELVQAKVDVILSGGTPATHALQRATATIPIVNTIVADPVAEGFAMSLARPGKNITGLASNNLEIVQKQVELLVKGSPRLQRVAVLSNPVNQGHPPMQKLIEEAARRTGRRAIPTRAQSPEEIESAFASMAREHAEAVIILGDALFIQQGRQIAGLARAQRMASIFTSPEYADAGGLMSYGPDILDHYRRAATFIDKIFKGARPGDLPIEEPTLYFLVINRGTAKAIGLQLPQELLLRADRVIE